MTGEIEVLDGYYLRPHDLSSTKRIFLVAVIGFEDTLIVEESSSDGSVPSYRIQTGDKRDLLIEVQTTQRNGFIAYPQDYSKEAMGKLHKMLREAVKSHIAKLNAVPLWAFKHIPEARV